jgi:hypothetical protein
LAPQSTLVRDKYINEALAHAIMEAEKYHDLPSINWRLRKSGDVAPVWV